MGFVKIHDAILKSSILEEDVLIRWVWICLLVSCDKNGNIYGTREALARRANVTLWEFEEALGVLMKPDPSSTSSEEEGRRVVGAGNNLLHCVNYMHYRGMKDPDEVREANRIRKRRQREKEKVTTVTQPSQKVTKGHDKAEAEAEAEAEADTSQAKRKRFVPPTSEEVQSYLDEKGEKRFSGVQFVDANIAKGWVVGSTKTPMKDWKAVVRTWIHNRNDEYGSGGPPAPTADKSKPGWSLSPGAYDQLSAEDQARVRAEEADIPF